MSIFKYLKENIRLILFFIILMLFISAVIIFDRSNRLLPSDSMYIIAVSFILFISYMLIDYIKKSKHIKSLLKESNSRGIAPVLPKPESSIDEAYTSIIERIFGDYINRTEKQNDEFKENIDFMTAWAHEIKTPITVSKLLLEGSMDRSDIDSIKEEMDKIENYVEKVLYNARSGEFSNDYIIAEENLNKLITESVKKHSMLFIKKHIEFNDNIQHNLEVDTDRKWLLFIFDQLLSNALKYTPEYGCITVTSEKNRREKILNIIDNGSGIKSEDLKKIFAKSFTGSNGREINSKATGFGLYLSQKLAKRLGHYLTIDSVYGKGTKVSVHFPYLSDYYNVAKM